MKMINTIDFQRKEFLGDRVYNLIICDYIFDRYSNKLYEDKLNNLFTKYVNRDTQKEIFILMYPNEKLACNRNEKIYSDILESRIGESYKQVGFEKTKYNLYMVLDKIAKFDIDEKKFTISSFNVYLSKKYRGNITSKFNLSTGSLEFYNKGIIIYSTPPGFKTKCEAQLYIINNEKPP